VKYFWIIPSLAVSLWAQRTNNTATYDINGNKVEGARFSEIRLPDGGTDRRETVRNINGQRVPIQTVDEKVVSESGGVRVVERTVKKFDASGNAGAPEKVRVEERKNSDGSTTTSTSVLRADINGNYAVAERAATVTRKSGNTTSSETTVERPTLNGSLELIEKKEDVVRELSPGNTERTSVRSARDTNGRFAEIGKEVVEVKKTGDSTVEKAAVYESTNGQLELVRQKVSHSTKRGQDEDTVVDVFVPNSPGQVGNSKPQLAQRQVIERQKTAKGAVETISVQRAYGGADQSRLGPAQKVEETTCTGKCN
jgi:hypothetical protein